MTLAPVPGFPEKPDYSYERTLGNNRGGNRGPQRFMEGVANDRDVPNDFGQGSGSDVAGTGRLSSRSNPSSQFKYPEQTMRERMHVGAASWIEAPSVLAEFVQGSQAGYGMPSYEMEFMDGGRQQRRAGAVVSD